MDIGSLFEAFAASIDRPPTNDEDVGWLFRQTMASLMDFDHVVVFAYRGKERPIELYSSFDPDDHVVFVSLYQAGPYLLDPFYHAARERRHGVFRMRQLAPDRFFSSEYYRSYYVKTGLAEEVGFFVAPEEDVSVVLSLMRRQETGAFSPGEFALLQKALGFVAKLVACHWSSLGARFDEVKANRTTRRTNRSGEIETVWTKLKLTAREATIMELVLQGHSSESIGLKLRISTGTVKVHRRNVYRKLGIASQTQLLSIYLNNL
jgi:DNA-binding CsgD family transcriptional regulator